MVYKRCLLLSLQYTSATSDGTIPRDTQKKSGAKPVPQRSRFGKWPLFAKRVHFILKKGQAAPLRKKRSQNSATKGPVLRTKTVPLRSRFGSSFFSECYRCIDLKSHENTDNAIERCFVPVFHDLLWCFLQELAIHNSCECGPRNVEI